MKFNKIQFILIADRVHSIKDKNWHYISGKKLQQLYNLPLKQCSFCDEVIQCFFDNQPIINPFQIILRPREYGDYKEHLEFCLNEWMKINEHN